MSIAKPYFRVFRPSDVQIAKYSGANYVKDRSYAPDRINLTRAFELLEEELSHVLEYVEPVSANNAVYSHQLYQMLLRACTEVEAISKAILTANDYKKSGRWDVGDYRKIEVACKLSEYAVTPLFWEEQPGLMLKPFHQWNANVNGSLKWYQAYNAVKHNRHEQFQQATLENVVEAIAGVLVLLFAQFGIHCFDAFHGVNLYEENDGWLFHDNCLFGILPPNWPSADCYDDKFQETWKSDPLPFQEYPFPQSPQKRSRRKRP